MKLFRRKFLRLPELYSTAKLQSPWLLDKFISILLPTQQYVLGKFWSFKLKMIKFTPKL